MSEGNQVSFWMIINWADPLLLFLFFSSSSLSMIFDSYTDPSFQFFLHSFLDCRVLSKSVSVAVMLSLMEERRIELLILTLVNFLSLSRSHYLLLSLQLSVFHSSLFFHTSRSF